MSVDPKVTIGLPVSSEPLPYVRDAVYSVLNQSFTDWELIVATDGAPAETVAWLRSCQDPRVRIFPHDESKGLPVRLNEMTRNARGEYIARLDADDVMTVGRIERQLALIEAERVDLVSGRAIIIDENGAVLAETPSVPSTVDVEAMFRASPFIHPTVFARAEWFREHPYDEDLARSQDRALWISSFHDSKFIRDDKAVLFYRVSADLNPAKYARTAQYERRIIRRYGPYVVGRLSTARLICASVIKQAIVWLASRGGLSRLVFQRRYAGLNDESHAIWAQHLEQCVRAPSAAVNPLEDA